MKLESAWFNVLNKMKLRILFQLEEQNERLRLQNLKCTAQLQVLKSCADRAKHWQTSVLFSNSVTVWLSLKIYELMDKFRTVEQIIL